MTNAWCAVGLCPYVIPTKADHFDTPGGNPNPASPNNNNTLAGATPLGTGTACSQRFSMEFRQTTVVAHPKSEYLSGERCRLFQHHISGCAGAQWRCFSSGFSFDFGTKVNARIFVNGAVTQSYVDTSSFWIGIGQNPTPIVLEIMAPFPGQILTYKLNIAFFLHFKSDCYQPGMPNIWDEIRGCPMCDLQVLNGFDRVILNPLYREPNGVAVSDHYFYWKGEGALQIPVNVLQGNNLHVDLVNEADKLS